MAYREVAGKAQYRKGGLGARSRGSGESLNTSIKTLRSGLGLQGSGSKGEGRVKSASQSRHQSPMLRKPGSRSPPVVKRVVTRPYTGAKSGLHSISRVQSANSTPKRGTSTSGFLPLRVEPPGILHNLKRKTASHRRDMSLEIKASRPYDPPNVNTSVDALPKHSDLPNPSKPRVNFSFIYTDKTMDLNTDREKLSRYLRRYYIQKRTLPTTTSDFYHYERLIGRGAFGKVSLATHILTGLQVAIKSLDKSYMQDERTRRKVFNEVINMRKASNFHVIRLLEVFESSHHFNMVLEYCGGGDLLQFIKIRGKIPESEAKLIFYQVTEGIFSCHKQGIVHRDVKLDNILLDSRLTTAKICDFGVSRMAVHGQRINDQCGTPAYIAPEIVVDCGYDAFYVDLWSMGVLLYAMVVGTVPFRASTLPDLSMEVQQLIAGLLQLIPHNRLKLEEVLVHPWFEKTIDETQVAEGATLRFVGRICAHESGQTSSAQIDQQLLAQLDKFGLPPEFAWHCLQLNELNHATATYELLAVTAEAAN